MVHCLLLRKSMIISKANNIYMYSFILFIREKKNLQIKIYTTLGIFHARKCITISFDPIHMVKWTSWKKITEELNYTLFVLRRKAFEPFNFELETYLLYDVLCTVEIHKINTFFLRLTEVTWKHMWIGLKWILLIRKRNSKHL